MKIIVHGKPQVKEPDPIYTGTCIKCGCQLEAARDEITVHAAQTTHSDQDGYLYVNCPTIDCDQIIIVTYRP